jgi:hypothetical protein
MVDEDDVGKDVHGIITRKPCQRHLLRVGF